jgi:hypothetical protein
MAFAGFNLASAVTYLAIGWLAEVLDPARAVSLAGAIGFLSIAVFRFTWRQDRLIHVLKDLAKQQVQVTVVPDRDQEVQPAETP